MTQVHSFGPFWCRTLRVLTWVPAWLGRTTMNSGSYRSSIHPVVQIWPGRAVAFGIWGPAHTEEEGLILCMRSFGRSKTPRTEVINPDDDAVGIARPTGREWDWEDPISDLGSRTPLVRRGEKL